MNLDSLSITEGVLAAIAELDEFKGAWRALSTLAPERLTALRQVATIESIGSSTRIEGSKLSDREVEKLLSNLHIKAFETRDEQEVAGYATVMNTIFESWENIPFDENHIKQFHRDLLQFSDKDQRHRGEYKKLDNHVEAFDEDGNSVGIVFQTDSPFDTPRLMEELTQWTIRSIDEKRHHPLIIAAVFIVSFLAIHPFQDGNGRLSRVLTTLLLLKAGYLYVPYSSLESLIEKNKEGYYLALRRTQGAIRTDQVNWQPWLLFFLEVLLKQKRKLETKVEKEKLMQKSLPELSLQILSLTKEHGSIAVSDVVAATDANRNTVKKHLQNLVASGYLLQQGARKAARYVLH
ncbi:MAG: Fic family protein [Pseudomonadales bacterium]|nr:Fic family protein [Pseudomonadales bacterium]